MLKIKPKKYLFFYKIKFISYVKYCWKSSKKKADIILFFFFCKNKFTSYVENRANKSIYYFFAKLNLLVMLKIELKKSIYFYHYSFLVVFAKLKVFITFFRIKFTSYAENWFKKYINYYCYYHFYYCKIKSIYYFFTKLNALVMFEIMPKKVFINFFQN